MITPQAWSLVKLLINNLYTIKRPWSFPVLNLVKWLIFNLQSTKRLLGKSRSPLGNGLLVKAKSEFQELAHFYPQFILFFSLKNTKEKNE